MQISSFESSLCRRFSFIQQTHETIFRIHKASCSLVLSVDNPHYILLTIRSESSYLYLDLNNLYKTVAIIQPKIKLVQKDNNSKGSAGITIGVMQRISGQKRKIY